MHRHVVPLLLFSAVAAHAAPLGAQDAPDPDARARRLYEAGVVAFEDGQFEEAANLFERAFELSDRAALLFNIGTANDRAGFDAEALSAYRRYLERMPEASNRSYVESRIDVLERRAQQGDSLVSTNIAPTEGGSGSSVFEEWWFWAILGVVVAGGAVGTWLALDASRGTAAVPQGDLGVVVMTLGGS